MDDNGYPLTWTKEQIEESEHFCRHHPENVKAKTLEEEDEYAFVLTQDELRCAVLAAQKAQVAYYRKRADMLELAIKAIEKERLTKTFK